MQNDNASSVQQVVRADTGSTQGGEGLGERAVRAEAARLRLTAATSLALTFEMVALGAIIFHEPYLACALLGAATLPLWWVSANTAESLAAGANTCVSDGPADAHKSTRSAEGPFAARNG